MFLIWCPFVTVTWSNHHAIDSQGANKVEEFLHFLGIAVFKHGSIGGNAKSSRFSSANCFYGNIKNTFTIDAFVVMFAQTV